MKKQCRRTVRDPMGWIHGRTLLAADQTQDIGLAYHTALDLLLGEHGTEQAWSTLACTLNVALLLAEQGIRADAEPIIILAQEALMRVRKGAQSGGEWRINLSHHHKQALLSAIATHDEQCAECTKGQIAAALKEVHRRVSDGEVMV